MSLDAARRRVRADRQALQHRLEQAIVSKESVDRELKRFKPGWFVAGGLLAGVVVGGMPAKAIGGLVGALAAFSLRLLSTPLGPAAFGALMARRAKGDGDERRVGRNPAVDGD